MIRLDNSKSPFAIKGTGKTQAMLISGEGDLLSHSNGNSFAAKSSLTDNNSAAFESVPDAIAFGTLAADAAPIVNGFLIDSGEFDLDRPTKGFSSIPEAIEDIRQGKVVHNCFLKFSML